MNTESCHCGLLSCKEVNTRDKDNKFTLQPLPYAENSLEPYISEKTVKFHYGKHLAAYIDNTNKLKAGTQFDDQPIHEIIKKASGGLFNNAAQVFNHYFYFEALHHSGAQAPRGKLSNLPPLVIDDVIENINLCKCFNIICDNPDPICDYIINTLHRSATIYQAQGAFTHHNKTVIMTTMSRGQALKLRSYIRQVEPHAFMLISNSSEIVGKGFLAS